MGKNCTSVAENGQITSKNEQNRQKWTKLGHIGAIFVLKHCFKVLNDFNFDASPIKFHKDMDFDFSSQKTFLWMWIWIFEGKYGGDKILMATLR